jgi:hypothetical protein
MRNTRLMHIQDMVNDFVDSRPAFWETNAKFVGTREYLSIGDKFEKLRAQLEQLKRHHRITAQEAARIQLITDAIASLSRPRAQPGRRRVAASR